MILADETVVVLDVREYSEFCGSALHIEDAANLPWMSNVLQDRFIELPTDVDLIVVCASGARSHVAASFLDGEGFTNVYDLQGGMGDWIWETESCDVEPVLTLRKVASGAEINWSPTAGTQDYDLLRGLVENLGDAVTYIDLGPTDCLSNDSPFTYSIDATIPFGPLFYLARQKDGPWGQSSAGQNRRAAGATCE
jgi:rhodanese-related sulfurtransferase